MPETFDPYRKWLGIPPAEQPPHHYRLLAIGLFEDDPDVIESAADQRMAHLRTFQSGPHSAHSQKLLNEVAAAKLCLLSADRKAEYDGQLRLQMAEPAAAFEAPSPLIRPEAATARPHSAEVHAAPVSEAPELQFIEKPEKLRTPTSKRRPAIVWAAGSAVICICVAAAYAMLGGGPTRRSASTEPLKNESQEQAIDVAQAAGQASKKPATATSDSQNQPAAPPDTAPKQSPAAPGAPQVDMSQPVDKSKIGPPATAFAANEPSDEPLEASGPALAVAPFNAQQARAHQQAWANHLNVPVEQENSLGMRLVLIPPGEFTMGSTPEQIEQAKKHDVDVRDKKWAFERLQAEAPAHRVTISRPHLLGAAEVTIGQYRRFVDATNYITETEQFGGGNSTSKEERDPSKKAATWRGPGGAANEESAVGQLTWNDAVMFCNWLSQVEHKAPCYVHHEKAEWELSGDGNGYRLPTEAEWEYACRAGTTTQYSFGDDPENSGEFAWSIKDGPVHQPHAVAVKKPNALGLFDMHGNVGEWCHDFLGIAYYAKSPPTDPLGAAPSDQHVIRGGAWDSAVIDLRSAFRRSYPPFWRFGDLGFRVMCVSTSIGPAATPLADRGQKPAVGTGSEPMPERPAPPDNDNSAKQSQVAANEIATLKEHAGGVTRVVFHPTLPLLASAGKDGRVLLWNLDKQTQRQFAKSTVEVWALKFSPNGDLLAFGSRDWWKAQVSFHDLDSSREVKTLGEFKFGGGAVASIAYSPDGLLFAAGQDDGTVRLWSTVAFQELSPLSVGSNVLALTFGPVNVNRKQRRTEYVLIAGCKDGTVKKLSVTTAKTKDGLRGTFEPTDTSFPQLGSVLAVRFTPDAKSFACTRSGGVIYFHDPDDGKQLSAMQATGGEVNWISFHPQLPWCVTAHNTDRMARVWDIDKGKVLCEMKGHTGGVLCAEFSRDGQRVATAAEDFSIKLWELVGAGVPEAPKRARKAKPPAPLVGD